MAAIFVFLLLCSTLAFAVTKAQVYTISVACTTPSSTSLHLAGSISPSPALLQNIQVLDISSNNIPNFKFFNVSNMQRQIKLNGSSPVQPSSLSSLAAVMEP